MATTQGDDGVARRIEAGRLLFAKPWRFVVGVASASDLPPSGADEVAFAGRSNVGKSSLLNAIAGQKALARISNTPGRTRQINLFTADAGVVIADLPGYGHARAPKREIARWTRTVFDYLRGRSRLRRVYLLVDGRHGLKANDGEALDILDAAAVSWQIVLTKCDKLRPDAVDAIVGETAAAIASRPAGHPAIIATSARTGLGIDRLRAEIAEIAAATPIGDDGL